MTTILVPAPPKSAFNKNRPVSDLLKGQLKHFYHIEAKLSPGLRSGMTARDYATEEGAAKYIAHLTYALRSVKQAKVPTPIRPSAKPSATPAVISTLAARAGVAPEEAKNRPAKKKAAITKRSGRKP